MEYGNFMLEAQSPRCCFSNEKYNERQNNQPITIGEIKIPECF